MGDFAGVPAARQVMISDEFLPQSNQESGLKIDEKEQQSDIKKEVSRQQSDIKKEVSEQPSDIKIEVSGQPSDINKVVSRQLSDIKKEVSGQQSAVNSVMSGRQSGDNSAMSGRLTDFKRDMSVQLKPGLSVPQAVDMSITAVQAMNTDSGCSGISTIRGTNTDTSVLLTSDMSLPPMDYSSDMSQAVDEWSGVATIEPSKLLVVGEMAIIPGKLVSL